MAHAALTCSGATPRYFTPGFGPLALAWGWLLLGVLLGLLSRRAAEAIVGLTSGRQLPHTPWSWEALLRELSARTQDPSRHEVLQYLLQRGEAALVELSIGAHAGFFAGSPSRRRHHGRRWCGFATARQGHASTDDRAAPASARLTPHPYHGRRVGEAAHPGPPCGTDVEHVESEPCMRLPKCRCCPRPARPHRATAQRTWMLPTPYRIRLAPSPLSHPHVKRLQRRSWARWHHTSRRRRRRASRHQQHRRRMRVLQALPAPLGRSRHPAPSPHCPGRMPARRAQRPASAIPGCMSLFSTRGPAL